MSLTGKKILIGVTGGIAAYKAANVVSKLVQAGAEVRVVMTAAARRFVTPLTFATLSHQPVLTSLWEEPLAHVELARWADLIAVVPATFDIVGKLAAGIADDLLTTVIAATRAPVLLCPAMDSQMFTNPVFQGNRRKLEGLGYRFLEPEEGRLASGRVGVGRLPSEEKIVAAIAEVLEERGLLAGKKVLVTAGPTRERIDPMRCITNRSSGKMGYALAAAAHEMGAQVLLISGPTQLEPPPGVQVLKIESAEELRDAMLEHFPDQDLIIMAAAVADWRPKASAAQKLAKEEHEELTLELERTPDILQELGEKKRPGQFLVGFAAETETERLQERAREKLMAKNLDLIVANDVSRPDSGPEVDVNAVTLLWRDGKVEELPHMQKRELARDILLRIVKYFTV